MLLQQAIKDDVDKQHTLYSLIRWRNWDHCHNNRRTKQTTFLGPEYLELIYIAIREKEELSYLIKSEF